MKKGKKQMVAEMNAHDFISGKDNYVLDFCYFNTASVMCF